jgi:hypothetical protein
MLRPWWHGEGLVLLRRRGLQGGAAPCGAGLAGGIPAACLSSPKVRGHVPHARGGPRGAAWQAAGHLAQGRHHHGWGLQIGLQLRHCLPVLRAARCRPRTPGAGLLLLLLQQR